jgi:KUP system potassium uptake protein
MVLPNTAVGATSPSKLPTLSLAALGIVFGDIGTSPLYTFKTVLNLTGARADTATLFGALSLIVWTLFLIATVKYVSFAMRVDNDGEGGILALMSLLSIKKQQRPAIVALGLEVVPRSWTVFRVS